jgi:hypothetical protein
MRSRKSHGYDSQLERRLGSTFGVHNKKKVTYMLQHTYTCDFIAVVTSDTKTKAFLLEAKGIFRGSDRAKYLAVKEQYEDIARQLKVDSVELIFIFQDPSVKVGRTKSSHGEWANKNGFKYIPEGGERALLQQLQQLGEVTYV